MKSRTTSGSTRKGRVLVLNQYALPRSQGGGTRHIDLFGRLEGWEPLIVATSRNHATQETYSSDDPRFRLVNLPAYEGNGIGRILGWILYMLKATVVGLRTRPLDVVYASSPHLLAGVAGYLVSRIRRKPLVLEIRDLWPESIVAAGALRAGSRVHRALVSLERFLYRKASRIVAVTPGWESHFERLGIEPERITVVPNGTEPSDFVVNESREELRDQYEIAGFTAIFAGSHGPKDGIDLILDAAREVPEISFLLVGAGSAKEAATQRAEAEGLVNVEFRSTVAKAELPKLLAACDVGIHSVSPLSVFELGMSPNKLFDYMATGIPIVSNASTAIAGLTSDGECGHVGGPGSLGQSLRAVASASDEQRLQWGRTGRQLTSSRFSRVAAAAQLRTILHSIVGSPTFGSGKH